MEMDIDFNVDNNNNNLIDIRGKYKDITKKFLKYYYNNYDNSFGKLNTLYKENSYFTWLKEEIVGFQNYINRLKQYNIKKFKHNNKINYSSQPVGTNSILINVTGKISINNSIFQHQFSETIVLVRDKNNKFYIPHTMFVLLD